MFWHLHYLLLLAVSFFSFIGQQLPFIAHYHHRLSICVTALINVYNATPLLVLGTQDTNNTGTCSSKHTTKFKVSDCDVINEIGRLMSDKSNAIRKFPSKLIESVHLTHASLSNTLNLSLCSQSSQEGASATGNSYAWNLTCHYYAFIRKIFNVSRGCK